MGLARLLYARVMAVHSVLCAPIEPFDEFTVGQWTFWGLGGDGALGIKACPEIDGDALIVALPSRRSNFAVNEVLRIMEERMATGRKLYTLAWKGHARAININQRVGGKLLGLDEEGFYHFEHTLEGLRRGKKIDA